MNANLPQDELLERYERAKMALPDGLPTGPSAAVRERIMHAAREQADAINSVALSVESMPPTGLKSSKNTIEKSMRAQDAANDSFWNIRALGSLAVMGLAGLLWWQFEHGTPEEQLAAKSAAPSSTASASAPVPAALEAAAPTSSALPTPAPTPASVSASVTPRSAALPPSPSPAPAAPVVSNPSPAANAPEKLAQAKMASQSRSKAETAEIATPNTPIAQANDPSPSPSPAPQAPRAPAQDAAATDAAQTPQTDKVLKDIPSRTARPNVAAEPSLTRSLETAQAPSVAAVPPPPPALPAPAARAAAPPMPAAAPAPRSSPAASATPQAIIASPTLLLSAIETRDAPALQQALSQGASPNARSPGGNTALHQAVMQRWTEGVRILLAAGADRAAKNSKGHTAADVALELGYSDMAELLDTQK